MIVLGIESATPVASVALVNEQGLLGQTTLNIGLTHSEQLLPLIDSLLKLAKQPLSALQGVAISLGPGSFTGLRIGMATAKGLAQGVGLPLIGVSTLLGLAYAQAAFSGLISPVMNARRAEVYTALYRFKGARAEEVLPPQAIIPQLWAEKLGEYGQPLLLTGDGVAPYQECWDSVLQQKVTYPPLINLTAAAASIAWLGRQRLLEGQQEDIFKLKPFYIRPAEAQVRSVKPDCTVKTR